MERCSYTPRWNRQCCPLDKGYRDHIGDYSTARREHNAYITHPRHHLRGGPVCSCNPFLVCRVLPRASTTMVAAVAGKVVVWGYGALTFGWSPMAALLWTSSGLIVTAIRPGRVKHHPIRVVTDVSLSVQDFIRTRSKTRTLREHPRSGFYGRPMQTHAQRTIRVFRFSWTSSPALKRGAFTPGTRFCLPPIERERPRHHRPHE